MSSLTLEPKRAGLQVKRGQRAPLACLRCRYRKVRCDVAKNGQPCMNCNLDDHSCIVTKRGSRCSSNQPWRIRGYTKDRNEDSDPKDSQEQQSSDTTVSQLPQQSPARPRGRSNEDDQEQSSSRAGAFPAQPGGTRFICDVSDTGKTHADDLSTIYTKPTLEYPIRPSNMVVYCTYSFVGRANVFYTPVQDIQFLDSEGCFQLPEPVILDQFLRQYFMHVHPLLPMLSELDFWDAYSRPNPPESKTLSLLLIQAMLFASCNLIYDSGLESSTVATSQAALLLTFWTPPLNADSKPNTMWLIIAIENAKRLHADRYSDVSDLASVHVDSTHSTLRRLWWCCIIRDRILPLGLRRSIQITPAHFDLGKNMRLGCMELQAEIRHSRMHCQDTREGLATIIEEVVKLSIVLTDILLLTFPLKNTAARPNVTLLQLQECKEALSEWYNESPFRNTGGATAAADRSVVLNINLMYTYYHWATIVMCHFNMRNIQARHLDRNQTSDIFRSRKEARTSTISIVESLDRLNKLGLTQCLPITIVAYAAFPLALHIFDVTCSDTPRSELSGDGEQKLVVERRLSTLIHAMKILHEQYDGVEGVVKTIRHIVDYVHSYVPKSVTGAQLSGDTDLALRVSLAMDWSLSSGRPSGGEDFTSYLGALFHQPSRINLPVSPVETDDGQQEDTTEGRTNDLVVTAAEQPVSDWIVTTPSSFAENTETAESEPFLGSDECPETPVTRDYGQSWSEESDLEKRINELLENCGELNFDDLLIPT
ncbi:hypothetical protein ACJ41O_009073 [Fusarium nematophilum]